MTKSIADDAADLLRWAYGDAAKATFLSMRLTGVHRVGQAFMNTLSIYDPPEYEKLVGTLADPFHRDENLPMAIERLTSK